MHAWGDRHFDDVVQIGEPDMNRKGCDLTDDATDLNSTRSPSWKLVTFFSSAIYASDALLLIAIAIIAAGTLCAESFRL